MAEMYRNSHLTFTTAFMGIQLVASLSLARLHLLSTPTFLFTPSKSNLKWLKYDQNSHIASHSFCGWLGK